MRACDANLDIDPWHNFFFVEKVLKRIVSYARSSADLLTNLILQGHNGPYTWECLFRTPLNNYDAEVLLHRDKLSYPRSLLFPAEINNGKHVIWGRASKGFHPYMSLGGALKSLEDARKKLMANFDPVRYLLEDLKREFPDTFNVWCDSLGGDAIGLTWEKRDSKKRGRDEGDEIRRDRTDILREVGEVGKGFVKSVYLLKAPRFHS
ncbi:uncharacterized protein [Elaeis guineensis]|uniref:uncharacterized protein n=1 Tax=Elaeis guineensis var. tenera TaxID=51953 RepID=UPI003C6D28CD